MRNRVASLAGLLFLSGMCALVYQSAWLREFRLVFGASTLASAAVLAIFMGGLGLGNAWLGRRADRHPNPLAYYARLEFGVALAAVLTPWLVDLVRAVYVWLGGQSAIGATMATLVRLALSALVLAVPTVLMGGTLPAAAKAVTGADDPQRHRTALLYGANTLGAVLGTFLANFSAFEAFGTRHTLRLACFVNVLVALLALLRSRTNVPFLASAAPIVEEPKPQANPSTAGLSPREKKKARLAPRPRVEVQAPPPPVPAWVIYVTAGVVGFAFFLMELVWYRMFGPLLGGTTYTFGLILATALLGIGLGGAAYALVFRRFRASLAALAFTCGLEAVCVIFPCAMGDRLAILVAQLHQSNTAGFYIEVLGWGAIALLVIFPAALVSGIQFPLLVALLGRAEEDLGRQLGLTVAWNTAGSIAGSLAGGFGLLPLLSAPGVWRAAAAMLGMACTFLLMVSLRRQRQSFLALGPLVTVLATGVLLALPGPTAVWRHSSIGAGRAYVPTELPNKMRRWLHSQRQKVVWQADGIESSTAIAQHNGLAFIVNGKSDGHALGDASTQIMLGLTAALLHPDGPANSKTAFVVGLGTGETAGWLAEVPAVERVDVVELEPVLDEMARRCAPVNHRVLEHPKVRRTYNDAREVLLTTRQQYDLIVSEPSNPYRAGVASLFTQEFYLAGRNRLRAGGLFIQWLQAYEIDEQTIRTVLATLRSVFPAVEIWQTSQCDMLLIGSIEPVRYDVAALRQRITQHPFPSALMAAWRVADLEGVLSHYVGGAKLVDDCLAAGPAPICTDDRNEIEYGFARSLGRHGLFQVDDLRKRSRRIAADRPIADRPIADAAAVDWDSVARQRRATGAVYDDRVPDEENLTAFHAEHRKGLQRMLKSEWKEAVAAWQSLPAESLSPSEISMLAYAYAHSGDVRAEPLIERLGQSMPTEARLLHGLLLWRQKRAAEATDVLVEAVARLRTDPWPRHPVAREAIDALLLSAHADRSRAPKVLAVLEQPFAVGFADFDRYGVACRAAAMIDLRLAAPWIEASEPNVPWVEPFLQMRKEVYTRTGHALANQAAADLDEFRRLDKEEAAVLARQEKP